MEIKASAVSSTAVQMSLTAAILLYGESGRSGRRVLRYASLHDIAHTKGKPVIMAGVSITKEALITALQTLLPDEYGNDGLFAENLLAKSSDCLAWYVKPRQRQVWFKCRELGDVTASAHQPGLVFIVSKGGWYVFAIKGDERPVADTQMFVAPYFNVWQGGHICVGNVELPNGEMKFNTEAWEECFFRSYFTHPNVHTSGGLTKYRGGIFALWRSLLKGRDFPQNSLVPTNETLADAFERITHGR